MTSGSAMSVGSGIPYEAPRLDVVGSVHELTLLDTCAIINKQLGTPDLWANIPIEFCTGQGSV